MQFVGRGHDPADHLPIRREDMMIGIPSLKKASHTSRPVRRGSNPALHSIDKQNRTAFFGGAVLCCDTGL